MNTPALGQLCVGGFLGGCTRGSVGRSEIRLGSFGLTGGTFGAVSASSDGCDAGLARWTDGPGAYGCLLLFTPLIASSRRSSPGPSCAQWQVMHPVDLNGRCVCTVRHPSSRGLNSDKSATRPVRASESRDA